MSESRMKWKLDGDIAKVQIADDVSAEFDVSQLVDEEVLKNITFYGVKQKLADSTARRKDELLTAVEKKVQMEDVFERLVAGDWNQKEITRTNKLKTALQTATEEELAIMVKLALVTQMQVDNELVARRNEAA